MKLNPPRKLRFFVALLAGAACLSVTTASAQTVAEQQAQIDALEARIRAMENYQHVEVTGEGKKMMVTPWPDLDTFTRNTSWHAYLRSGVGFWGNGLGQTGSINLPGVGGRMRLGNEQDTYMEIGPTLTHLIGEGPDVLDVTFQMTMQFVEGVDKGNFAGLYSDGWGFGLVEAFIETKNVIASAPEVTFWAGQRFYDRYDIYPQDYYYVGTGGTGAGVYNIDVGFAKFSLAYFATIASGIGEFWKGSPGFTNWTLEADNGAATGDWIQHKLDLRLGEIDFAGGTLKLITGVYYQQGGDFTNDDGGRGHVEEAWGYGGGFVQNWAIADESFWGGNSSSVTASVLYGGGLINWADSYNLPLFKLNNAYNNALIRDDDPVGTFKDLDNYNNQKHGTANVFWVWNPTDDFSMGTWATAVYDDNGYTSYARRADGSLVSAGPEVWQFTGGVRPYWWFYGPFCIAASAGYEWITDTRGGPVDNFGADGGLAVFSIAPSIKPRGGFWTKPELRVFATYATWSSSMRGQVGYNDPNATDAWIFGVQGEIWF